MKCTHCGIDDQFYPHADRCPGDPFKTWWPDDKTYEAMRLVIREEFMFAKVADQGGMAELHILDGIVDVLRRNGYRATPPAEKS